MSLDADRRLLILYATETGNAQDAADRIARECRRIRFHCLVVSVDTYKLSELVSEELVVFVVSTTGSGLEPRSMTQFWKMLLRSDLPNDLFEDLAFGVFGLGDTAYEKFCWPAKKLVRRLESLGATQFCELGEGDEQHMMGIDGALDAWCDNLINKLLEMYPLPSDSKPLPKDVLPAPRVQFLPTSTSLRYTLAEHSTNKYYVHSAKVRCNSRMTADEWYQDVRHLEFDFEDDIDYAPGDVAVIHPEASAQDVDEMLTTLGWSDIADAPFIIRPNLSDQTLPDNLPSVATLKTILAHIIDFNAVPRRHFFRLLRHFTSNELERERLDEFLSLTGADELYEYCYKVRRTIKEVISEFRHVKIDKNYIFDIFPPMRPRQFSIASSVRRYPKQIHLCVAIVRYRTKLKTPRRGVCTTFLAGLRPGDSINVGIQRGFIRIPQDHTVPVICIGPGTGIAPMRAVIQERIKNGSSENTLYFGCRSATKDQHYHPEWKSYTEKQALTYRVACSRDGAVGVKRTYVQDLMRADSERIWHLVGEKGAYVLISGSSNKMPKEVKEAVQYAVEKHSELGEEGIAGYISEMEKEGRLIEECWS